MTENGKDVKKQVFRLTEDESDMALFKTKYNTTQKLLQAIAAMDDILSGLLTIVYTYWRSFPSLNLNCVLCKYLYHGVWFSIDLYPARTRKG